ncbi:MAG: hypothetical protein J1E99_02505 [Muribaculaceae bacterium]|nr:hypothetical protein [Muribaculaceae bacterium]
MKKFFPILSICASLFIAACSDKEDDEDPIIWDFANYNLQLEATPVVEGRNPFDNESEVNRLSEIELIEYKGYHYKVTPMDYANGYKRPESRFLMPAPFCLRLVRYDYPRIGEEVDKEVWNLIFGEFSPCDNYHDEPFKIRWTDGSITEGTFDCYINWKSKTEPDVIRNISSIGKMPDGWSIKVSRQML